MKIIHKKCCISLVYLHIVISELCWFEGQGHLSIPFQFESFWIKNDTLKPVFAMRHLEERQCVVQSGLHQPLPEPHSREDIQTSYSEIIHLQMKSPSHYFSSINFNKIL